MNRSNTLSIKPVSTRSTVSAMALALIALILWVTPALAAVPVTGIVYEGKSVPGAALGATRAEIDRSFGSPARCAASSTSSTYTCAYKVGGGGTVTVTYTTNFLLLAPTPNDRASSIRWSQELSGWKTTAGITTRLALENPKAVVAAYPKATVTLNSRGEIIRVRDSRLGIQVDWQDASPVGENQRHVSMAIFSPAMFTSSK